MGFDLKSDTGSSLRFSPSGWALALTLAEEYGWKPAGTSLARPEWSGEYASNEGQRVSGSDAHALAVACERALADPEYLRRVSTVKQGIDAAVAVEVPDYVPGLVNPEEMLAFRKRLEDLVAFCRGGSFVIE